MFIEGMFIYGVPVLWAEKELLLFVELKLSVVPLNDSYKLPSYSVDFFSSLLLPSVASCTCSSGAC